MFFDPLDVFQAQLGLNDFHVTQRVDITLDMGDLVIVECAHDLEDTVHSAHVRKEGVAKTCASRRAGRQPSDVDAREEGRHARCGLVQLAEPFEARIWYGDTSLLGISVKHSRQYIQSNAYGQVLRGEKHE